ncbi:MAG: DUF2835 domain-containing protein [Myxococcota bacterium]|nr:DUF2835 domain-containing protein [Myxococcota bacterium]
MRQFIFDLRITPEMWLRYYRSPNANVVATTRLGQRIQFGARHLQRFITHDGIRGTFCLTIDQNQDFVSLETV